MGVRRHDTKVSARSSRIVPSAARCVRRGCIRMLSVQTDYCDVSIGLFQMNILDKRKTSSWVPAVEILEQIVPLFRKEHFYGARNIVLLDEDYC